VAHVIPVPRPRDRPGENPRLSPGRSAPHPAAADALRVLATTARGRGHAGRLSGFRPPA